MADEYLSDSPSTPPTSPTDAPVSQAELLSESCGTAASNHPAAPNSLRPPPPFSIRVSSLTIVAPPAPVMLPLPIPIAVPAFLLRRRGELSDPPKELVRAATLSVEPGEVLAIAGGSGSGKTSLLNAIAGRMGNLSATGDVSFVPRGGPDSDSSARKTINARDRSGMRHVVGYVRQEDFLLPYLTVRETLSFAASLRLPTSVSRSQKEAIVEQTITELGLRDCSDVVVGGPYRKGISGGEKRRLSIGCVLVTLPSVLVLDEPTTGLDSFTAFQLLETLSRLARRGRAVILSIHQPRSDALAVFDKVTLLSSGSIVYSGFTQGLLAHFQAQGLTPDENTNPLDFVVDASSIDSRDDVAELESKQRVGQLVLAWREHELSSGEKLRDPTMKSSTRSMTDGNVDVELGTAPERVVKDQVGPEARPSLLSQTFLLTRRSFLNVTRNYTQSLGFLFQFVVIGVAIGLAFLNPPETPAGIQSLKTVVYQSTPAAFYLSIIVAVWIHCGELAIFDREQEDNLYQTMPYVVGSWISYLPGNIIFPTIYAIIIYFMAGFRRDNLAVNLFSFIAQCILQQLAAWAYALMAVGITRSFAQASMLANGKFWFSIPFILSSGYLIVDLPVWVSWTRWISPYFYGFHWIARLQFVGRTFACEGITGPARNACIGENVLVGLRFPLETPLYVYPLGLLGFVVVSQALAVVLLATYHPGGVKHAAQRPSGLKSNHEEKAAILEPQFSLDKAGRVEVAVEGLELNVRRRRLGKGGTIDKVILAEIDAVFPAGQVSVIMGPSGEDAHHLPALTVRETLRYAARLRLRGKTIAQCEARAEEVLRMLGLKACADNVVGGELLKGISGGEKRRLSLGVQLISDPHVLLADEPLSGLDAFTARNIMQSLKDIALSGRTVIVSVHQPRSDIWRLFDNVLLLAKGGRSAYSGPRSQILKAFASYGLECPADFNPADFLLDAISVDQRSSAAQEKSQLRVSKILESYRQASVSRRRRSREVFNQPSVSAELTPAPFTVAFPVILGRSFKNLWRQQDIFIARLANAPFMALLFWLFFGRLSLGPAGAQDRIGVLQETTALPFVGMLACLAVFPTEKALFFHEFKGSGRQSPTAFVLAYTAQEAFMTIFSSFVLSVVMVFGMNLQHTARIFVEFWFSAYALISVGESIGILFSTFFDNGGLAVSLVSAVITLFSQLNGIISVTLPEWLKVIGWATPMKSQSYLCIINEMTGLVFNCTEASIASGACIAATGEQLLDTFSITNQSTGKLVGILASLVVLFRLATVLALKIRVASL